MSPSQPSRPSSSRHEQGFLGDDDRLEGKNVKPVERPAPAKTDLSAALREIHKRGEFTIRSEGNQRFLVGLFVFAGEDFIVRKRLPIQATDPAFPKEKRDQLIAQCSAELRREGPRLAARAAMRRKDG